MRTAVASQDLATKNTNQENYYNRLLEERQNRKELQGLLLQERKDRRAVELCLESEESAHRLLQEEFATYRQHVEQTREEERKQMQHDVETKMQHKFDVLVRQHLEGEERSRRLRELESSEQQRLIEERARASVWEKYQQDLAEYRSQYSARVDSLESQLERAHATIQELSSWKYHAEMEMVKSLDERRALMMRLMMTVKAHAQLKQYKLILKYVVVQNFIRRYQSIHLIRVFHQTLLSLITSLHTAARADIKHDVYGQRGRDDRYEREQEYEEWLSTARSYMSSPHLVHSTLPPASLSSWFCHISASIPLIECIDATRTSRTKQWRDTCQSFVERNTQLTQIIAERDQTITALQQQLADTQTSLTTWQQKYETLAHTKSLSCGTHPIPSHERSQKLFCQQHENTITQLRNDLAHEIKQRQILQRRYDQIMEHQRIHEKHTGIWESRELERGWKWEWQSREPPLGSISHRDLHEPSISHDALIHTTHAHAGYKSHMSAPATYNDSNDKSAPTGAGVGVGAGAGSSPTTTLTLTLTPTSKKHTLHSPTPLHMHMPVISHLHPNPHSASARSPRARGVRLQALSHFHEKGSVSAPVSAKGSSSGRSHISHQQLQLQLQGPNTNTVAATAINPALIPTLIASCSPRSAAGAGAGAAAGRSPSNSPHRHRHRHRHRQRHLEQFVNGTDNCNRKTQYKVKGKEKDKDKDKEKEKENDMKQATIGGSKAKGDDKLVTVNGGVDVDVEAHAMSMSTSAKLDNIVPSASWRENAASFSPNIDIDPIASIHSDASISTSTSTSAISISSPLEFPSDVKPSLDPPSSSDNINININIDNDNTETGHQREDTQEYHTGDRSRSRSRSRSTPDENSNSNSTPTPTLPIPPTPESHESTMSAPTRQELELAT